MEDRFLKSCKVEEARIQAAYAKRQQRDIRYSWFNPGHLFIIQQRERETLNLLRSHNFADFQKERILEIGCGAGYWIREFIKWGARPEHMAGVDLLPDRIAEARRLCPEAVTLQCGSARELEFPDATFDLVLQSTVFTSILDLGMKRRIASEMLRVVKADGLILWYDYHVNNPWNSDVQGVKKREIYEFFPRCRIDLRRITLAPPITRWLAPRSWLACHVLERLRIFNTHYLVAIQSITEAKRSP